MEVDARIATSADIAAITDMARAAIEELGPNRGGAVWRRATARLEPVDEGIAADLEDHRAGVVVGTIDDVPVGYGVVRVAELADGGRLGTITDLYTLPGARGVAVGEMVMDLLVDWARRAGCFGVDSLALPGDRDTKNFFESFGMVARAIIVHRNLEDT